MVVALVGMTLVGISFVGISLVGISVDGLQNQVIGKPRNSVLERTSMLANTSSGKQFVGAVCEIAGKVKAL